MKSSCDICDYWAGLSCVALYYFYATTPVCKAVLWFESLGEILKCNIQMEGIEQYFHAVLFIMLQKAVLSLVDEILKCDQSNESPEHQFTVVLFVCTFAVSRNYLRFFQVFSFGTMLTLYIFVYFVYIFFYFKVSVQCVENKYWTQQITDNLQSNGYLPVHIHS